MTIQLPIDIEQRLRAEFTDLDSDATETLALELFRRGKLSKVLGLDRFQINAYLKRHNILEGSLTMQDLDEQARTLDRVLGPVRC